MTEKTGPEGFYATMQRGSRTAYLLGPYATKAEAEAHVGQSRQLAVDVDPFAAFDGFGVTRIVMKPGAQLPPGKLNGMTEPKIEAGQ
jgi:hypothetical protein